MKKFTRDLRCPPDKSISHRAVMFGSSAKGKSEVRGLLLGEDCLSTVDCMRRMGAEVELCGDRAIITGAHKLKSADLYAGNSGTTMRLLCGLLAPKAGEWTLSGDGSLSARPMNRVILPLTSMGAEIVSSGGKAPLTVRGRALHGIDYTLPMASAQVKSALILAALGAQGVTRITEPERTRDHTEILLRHMGVRIDTCGNTVSLGGGQTPQGASITVAGDISSAAFPLVCGLVTGGNVTVRNVGLNPTRAGLIEVFAQIGAEFSLSDVCETGGEKTGTVTVTGLGQARPFSVGKEMLPRLVDEIPVLAVLACFLAGDSVITGAEELRVKESDRIAATVRLVRDFGGKAEETESGMVISGVGQLTGGATYHPQGDHRMAMSAAVAAAASRQGGTVLDGACVRVSYPDFWEMFLDGGDGA